MQEKRTSPRKQVDKTIEILDINSGEALGSLANISLGGFMFISSLAMPLNQLYHLRIRFPTPPRALGACRNRHTSCPC